MWRKNYFISNLTEHSVIECVGKYEGLNESRSFDASRATNKPV